ncbi:MAG: cache domain-containing protein [Gammaproteobacteria bacterium]
MRSILHAATLACVALTLALCCALAQAADSGRATPAQAKALVAHAIVLFDKLGSKTVFARINAPDGGFAKGDLYVFVFGPKDAIVAQAHDPSRVGLDADKLIDADGRSYGRMLVDDATATGAWVYYKRKDPLTGRILSKRSWVVRHAGYVFGAGVYIEKP